MPAVAQQSDDALTRVSAPAVSTPPVLKVIAILSAYCLMMVVVLHRENADDVWKTFVDTNVRISEDAAVDADEISDKNILYREGQSIPHVLHYTWPNKQFSLPKEEDPDGEEQRKILDAVENIRRSNEGWEVKVWTDEECIEFMNKYFSKFMKRHGRVLNPRKFWDVVRIGILYVHGGIYLDHDIVCRKGVSFAAEGWAGGKTELLLPRQRRNYGRSGKINSQENSFMGSVPGHPFWRVYWKNIVQLMPGHDNVFVLEHTGPRQLMSSFDEYVGGMSTIPQSIHLLPINQLAIPVECSDEDCSTSLCVHHHGISPAELKEVEATPQVKQWRETKEKGVRSKANKKKAHDRITLARLST